MKDYVILLATDDSALESVVKEIGSANDCEFHCVRTSREAVSMLMDGAWNQDVAVVDMDLRGGSRALLSTAGGAFPVIAISGKARPWLSSMVRHRRVRATLEKPVSAEKLRDAFQRVREGGVTEMARGR